MLYLAESTINNTWSISFDGPQLPILAPLYIRAGNIATCYGQGLLLSFFAEKKIEGLLTFSICLLQPFFYCIPEDINVTGFEVILKGLSKADFAKRPVSFKTIKTWKRMKTWSTPKIMWKGCAFNLSIKIRVLSTIHTNSSWFLFYKICFFESALLTYM